MNDCVFCKRLKFWKESHIRNDPDHEHVYKVALISHTRLPGHQMYRGRSVDYNTRGIGFALNYCPECGKKLDKEKN